jgi:putative sigma-54 modulation protein
LVTLFDEGYYLAPPYGVPYTITVNTTEKKMQIVVTARHGHLSPEHQAAVEAKVGKLLHYFNRVEAITVTIDLAHRHGPIDVEIQLNAEHKHDFIAKATDNDVFVAIDAAIGKMEHQIHKYKEKIQDHRRAPAHGEVLQG